MLEVETPTLAQFAVTDPQIESFWVAAASAYLQTSPEYAMKRLLAAGSGPIYQITKAFRAGEAGRWHNPEFTLLEWYRPGFDHHALMSEVDSLLSALLGPAPSTRIAYGDAFRRHLGIEIDDVTDESLNSVARQHGYAGAALDRIAAHDFLFSQQIQPALRGRVFVYDYPAEQAALARLTESEPPRAERFEVFIDGVELANGYHELCDADEQRQRFLNDIAIRKQQRRADVRYDPRLVGALEAGMPPSAGVAIGLDRLLAIHLKRSRLAEVMSFVWDRA